MKLSKIILENKRIVERTEVSLSADDANKLASHITDKLEDYLDTGNRTLLLQVVSAAIGDLLQSGEL